VIGGPAVTWRATLGYYALAMVAGSFFVALSYYTRSAGQWGEEGRWVTGFLFVYALTAVGALPSLVVFAFLLRRVTAASPPRGGLFWLAAGAGLGVAVPLLFSYVGFLIEGTYFPAARQPLKRALVFPFMGPMMYSAQPLWVLLIVAVATTRVLHVFHRRAVTGR
jgi:hypothetical protein